MSAPDVYIAHTHREWFDFLSARTTGQQLDEVNFWFPRAQRPPKRFETGEVVFFRLGAPGRAIAGYGFFASFSCLPLDLAWRTFGIRNGAVDRSSFYRLLGRLSQADLAMPLGCMILLDAHFWEDRRWVPWGADRGYPTTGVQVGRTEPDPNNLEFLNGELMPYSMSIPTELLADFHPVVDDTRLRATTTSVVRHGQGAFRVRLLDAYGGQCAVTGEHTEPVLDAAHIQDYLGPTSNHPGNGILLTKEFHALFDAGLMTIEPHSKDDYRVRISRQIKERWNNGRRYNQFDGQQLVMLPGDPRLRPSREALAWHLETRFEKVA